MSRDDSAGDWDVRADRWVRPLGKKVTWAVDLASCGAALLIALLVGHDQRLLYVPGRMVNRAAGGYRGEGNRYPRRGDH